MENSFNRQPDTIRELMVSKIADNAPIGILTFGPDWRVEFINENFLKFSVLYDLDVADLLNHTILEFELFSFISKEENLKSLREGISFEYEIKRIAASNGGVNSIFIKVSPVIEQNSFNGGVVVLEDIQYSGSLTDENKIKQEVFNSLFARIDDILLITDIDGEIKYSFGRNARKLKTPSPTGFNLTELIPYHQLQDFREKMKTASQKRVTEKLLLEFQTDSEKLSFACRIEPYINRKGQVQFLSILLYDITTIVLEKSELLKEVDELKNYRTVSEGSADALFAVDTEGHIIFWNTSSEQLFGYSKNEVQDKFIGKALGIFNDGFFNRVKEELVKKDSWKTNLNIFRKDGKKDVIEVRFTTAGEAKNIIVVLCNLITEKFETEQALIKSEEKFRNIVLNASQLVCSLNPDGSFNYVNRTFLQLLNYREEELESKKFHDLINPDFLRTNKLELSNFNALKSSHFELPFITRKGYPVFLQSSFVPVLSDKNQLKSVTVYLTDVTAKKEKDRELALYKSLFEVSEDGIAVVSNGRIMLTNDSFADIFGYDRPEALEHKDIFDLISSNDNVRAADYIKRVEQKEGLPGRLECLGRRLDGSNFYIEISAGPFEVDKRFYLVLIIRDITERKRGQQAIRESEEKYRNITENIDDFLYTYERIDNIFRPTFYTSSVERITGYAQADFLMDSKLILKVVHPDDFLMVKKKLKIILKSRIQLSEEFEFRIINKHGNIVWVRNKINLSRNNEGKVQRIYGLVSDISLRKKAEEELTKSTENLIKANETKDKFISIISHDLRTPFTSILGFTDLLLSDDDLSEEESKQYVKFIRESSLSMLSLVNSLLDWTRLQTGRIRFEPEKNNIKEVLESSINAMFGAAFQKNIEIQSTIPDEVFVFIDKNLIMQVFNNLLSNAIKFTRPGGKIVLSYAPSSKIRFLEFSIKDNGIGIKEENLKNLFRVDTKFTSEGTAGERGSGLGLSLVKEIIEKHGGKIWVESVLGQGTEFKFLLPIASATILLVDDSKTDRLLYSKILKNITPDYTIEVASNGREAYEKFIDSPPALIITDHLMPEMNGYELVQAIQKSEVKGKPSIIILSSEIDRITGADYNELGIEYIFSKPVNLSNFKQAVEKSLRKGLSN